MPRGEVLVAIINNLEDMRIAREEGWYRIPVFSARKWLKDRWPPRLLAFYQTKVFGSEAHQVNYCAEVRDIRNVSRMDLFPDTPRNHPKINRRYYQLLLGDLQVLPEPIVSHRWRRIVFIPTTFEKFNNGHHQPPRGAGPHHRGLRREAKVKSELRTVEINVEMVEDIAAQKDVLLRNEYHFKATEGGMGDLKRDEVGLYTCLNTVVGLYYNGADCQEFELFCERAGNSRQVSTRIQLGPNTPRSIGCPWMMDENVKKGRWRLNAPIIRPHQRTTLRYGNWYTGGASSTRCT